jgi:hypothetical protein
MKLEHMAKQEYYSLRTGKNPYASKIDLSMLLELFAKMYQIFKSKGYFQEAFGDYCVTMCCHKPGKLGSNIEEQMSLRQCS